MQMPNAEQRTAKQRLGIVNVTVKSSTNACAIGVKQIENKLEKCHANGATGNWLPQVLKKKLRYAPLKLQGQNVTKTGAGTRYLPLMAATDVPVARKLNECFCRLTTSTMMGMLSVNLARIAAVAQRSIFGCANKVFLRDTKFCA